MPADAFCELYRMVPMEIHYCRYEELVGEGPLSLVVTERIDG